MSEVKPVAGQWYEWQGSRVYCVGQDSRGHTIVNNECGTLNILRGRLIEELTDLPDCTGWDWEPETFPQYWSAAPQNAYVLRRSSAKGDCVVVGRDGRQSQWLWLGDDSSTRTRLTEAEALALLDKPQQPAEDPEEWVEITDPEHVLREGVDYVRTATIPNGEWYKVYGYRGQKLAATSCIARCRRKDLPKPKRTVTVPKWLVITDANTFVVEQTFQPRGAIVHRVGETTYTEQEDGTWIES